MYLKKMKAHLGRVMRIVPVVIFLLVGAVCISAQQSGTTQYFYDDNGRLTAVVAPDGETAIYDYDAAGNLLAIRRLPAGTLTLFSFNPQEGVPGDLVTFLGSGFVPGQTTVFFNGVNAAVTEITATRIVAEVPNGATTGIVTITTPNGSVPTPQPFTIRGMKVSPASARLYFDDTLQLSAAVYTQVLSQSVQWSVNGINGGNSTVGTISNNGLYTALQRSGVFTVRATLIEDPTIFSESFIEVRDPVNIKTYFSAISVRRGVADLRANVTSAVSVRRGVADTFANPTAAVSVRRGVADTFANPTASISVQKGASPRGETPISQGISVRFGADSQLAGARNSVSVSNAAVVESLSPLSIRRGLTTAITITGQNLTNITKLIFINPATGELINNITVSNITANSDGTSLTAEINIPSTMSLIRLVIVPAETGKAAQTADTGGNTIQIIQ